MTVGSLFSGIGGFDLGLERAGMQIKWQVENDKYCNSVLTKHWPTVTRYGDITGIDWRNVDPVDVICGGFPCQPFSFSGKRRSKDDNRYLWPEVVRCLSGTRPTWFIGENVPGIINLAFDTVCTDLETLGYEVATFNIPACAVGAPHQRKRIWFVAYAEGERRGEAWNDCERSQKWSPRSRAMDHSVSKQSERRGDRIERWPTEPGLGRVAHGVPNRVDRLRGLGNAVVPQIAEALGRMILATPAGFKQVVVRNFGAELAGRVKVVE